MRLERIAETDAHEGPVHVAEDVALYFTSLPRCGDDGGAPAVSIKRLDLRDARVDVVRPEANVANGMALDRDGRLVVCEQGTFTTLARIALVDRHTGEAGTATDACDGVPFNSPNDVVVARDGALWFTDPSYGHLQGFRPEPRAADAVYRFDPATRTTMRVAVGFDKPNGLAFSPGEDVLYVSDNGAPHHLLAFAVRGASLGDRRVVAVGTPEHPDGVKVDAAGRIYASSRDGVEIWDPDGAPVGRIPLPGAVNFAFGPAGRLFITTDTAVWAAEL